MKRKKGIMTMPLFEKIVQDYAQMEGGPISFTPVGGDALLDPHLIDRLRMLESYPEIRQLTLTTNGIALDRYSDVEIRYLLSRLDCIQVSIGGLDPATYKTMYAVDFFEKVEKSMDRLLNLNKGLSRPAHLIFAFRTNDWKFEIRFRRKLNEYRRRNAFISHIWLYANYSGLVKSDKSRNLVIIDNTRFVNNYCLYGSISMAVCWDGRITACGCADIDANKLLIGHAETQALKEIWSSEKRAMLIDSFRKGTCPKICKHCSAYVSETMVFSRPYFENFSPHQSLPLDFFHHFWGG